MSVLVEEHRYLSEIIDEILGDYRGHHYLEDMVGAVFGSPQWAEVGEEEHAQILWNGVRERVLSYLQRQKDPVDKHRLWINVDGDGKRLWVHREDASSEEVMEYIKYLRARRRSYDEPIVFFTNVYSEKRREERRRQRRAS